jgi:hypothetical protein
MMPELANNKYKTLKKVVFCIDTGLGMPVLWNTSWFKMHPPHTLGFVYDPKHPVFNNFLTSSYREIQRWDILSSAEVMHLEDFPATFRPIIQPIDTWFMNRRFEAKVGKRILIVSSADLSPTTGGDRPAAKSLYYSILNICIQVGLTC